MNPAYTGAEVAVLLGRGGSCGPCSASRPRVRVAREAAEAAAGCEVIEVGTGGMGATAGRRADAGCRCPSSRVPWRLLLFTAGTSGRPRGRCSPTAHCGPMSTHLRQLARPAASAARRHGLRGAPDVPCLRPEHRPGPRGQRWSGLRHRGSLRAPRGPAADQRTGRTTVAQAG
jgi:hypothetical protein